MRESAAAWARPPAVDPAAWTLDDVIERVAAANPTLGIAEARLAEARAEQEIASATLWPELGLGLGYAVTNSPMQAFGMLLEQEKLALGPSFDPTPGRTENWHGEVRLDWALFAPGRAQSRHGTSLGANAAAEAREAIERRLANAGVQAFLGLGAARELADVAAASVAVVERRLEDVRTARREGTALQVDVLRLEVRLAAARDEAERARLRTRQAEASLNRLMGRPIGAELALSSDAEDPTVGADLPDDLDALLDRAAAERRDLRAAELEVRAGHQSTEGARAAWLPMLSAFGLYDVDGAAPGRMLDQQSYSAGAQLSWRLSGRTQPQVRRAEARERAARARAAELTLDVEAEVRDAFDSLNAARETSALAAAAVAAAEEAYRIVAAAQDAGGATTTDVLEAEEAQRTARVRRTAARAAERIQAARLVAATGGIR